MGEQTLNFQTIFEAVPGLYLVLTPDFVIVAVSDAYLQATMRKREDVLGLIIFEAYPDNPDDPNATGVKNLRASLESVLKYRMPHTMAVQKYDIRRPESIGGGFEERYWTPVNSPVFGADGEITHIIHRAEDVTKFVQLQQQRNEQRQINQVLQTRTEQMEIDIYLRAQELREVNKKLEAANEALSELDHVKTLFFSNISHEFRTPLTLMLSPIEDALADTEAPLPAVQRERIEIVQRNGFRLLKLVNALLDFSKIEAGKVQVLYEPTDLAMLTAELASVFRSAIEQAGMQLIVDCPPLPEAIYIDRESWEKIVFNLLSNAFKFTLEGTITVELRWVESYVELNVKDTGIGIPPSEQPHLFERFHRVKGAQGRSFEGSGIGLALVQELVKLHGGTVKVTSVLEQGSCFTVEIPASRAHLPSDKIGKSRALASITPNAIPYIEEALSWLPQGAPQSEVIKPSITSSQPLTIDTNNKAQPERILLADDNADMREYIKRLLSPRYIVETVASGITALAAARENPPDLVLTDVMMPGMDGFELLRALRGDTRTQNISIILLSARAGEDTRIEGLETGADDYLIKPFSVRELLARIEANLKLANLRRTTYRREQTLRQEAEIAHTSLESVLSSLRDGFLTLDFNWCYTYINERQLEIIGMVRSEVIGRNIWEIFPDLVDSEFDQQLKRAMTEQTPIQFEYYYTSWNRWFENRVYPIPDGIAVLCADITERKQAQAVQLFLAAIVESSNDAIIGLMPSGKIVSWNASAERIFGYTEAEILGQDISILIPNEKILEINNIFAVMQHGEAINQLETVWKCKDEQLVDVAITVSPIQNLNNQVSGISATVRDIRERKKVELEREQLLAREQAAREEAERANRIKDEFLAVLSHELRSPLNPILGWSQLLQSSKLNATKTAAALATIERNAKLQVQLIDDLLDVSKIIRGKLVLNATETNLSNVIFSALETVRLAADAKSILIRTDITPMISVIGDATRLQQVVWNLLSNAVKFTDNGGQIEVCLTRVGADAQIQVKDTGIGISSDFLPYVFEHFKQEDSSITRKFGGLGLGLAIVRQLVELHGGTITVSSLGVGKGATFTVKIPLSENVAQTTLTQSNNILSDLSGVNILVVDDEPDSRELITFVLTEKHATVTAVTSGLEALNVLDTTSKSPDLLISDIGMPDMDGYTLMQIIRASERSKLIPAIAITAYAGQLNEQEAIKAGFLRHIAKPINPDEVVKVALELI